MVAQIGRATNGSESGVNSFIGRNFLAWRRVVVRCGLIVCIVTFDLFLSKNTTRYFQAMNESKVVSLHATKMLMIFGDAMPIVSSTVHHVAHHYDTAVLWSLYLCTFPSSESIHPLHACMPFNSTSTVRNRCRNSGGGR